MSKEHNLTKGDIQAANSARLNLGNDHDWFAPETMTSFFKQLYCRKESFDKKDIRHYLYYPTNNLSFQTAAKEFQLIEDDGVNVVVCWKNSIDLVQQLLVNGPSYMLMKKLSKYMVNINKTDFKTLADMGVSAKRKKGFCCRLQTTI